MMRARLTLVLVTHHPGIPPGNPLIHVNNGNTWQHVTLFSWRNTTFPAARTVLRKPTRLQAGKLQGVRGARSPGGKPHHAEEPLYKTKGRLGLSVRRMLCQVTTSSSTPRSTPTTSPDATGNVLDVINAFLLIQ